MSVQARIYSNLSNEAFRALRDIDRYSAETRRRLQAAVRTGTQETAAEAIRRAPMRSGDLKASIQYEIKRDGSQGVVRAKSKKAHLVEFGTGPALVYPKRRRAMKIGDRFAAYALIPPKRPRPFMRPAIEKERPAIERAVLEAIEKP